MKTSDQVQVVEPSSENKEKIKKLLTFETKPIKEELELRAIKLVTLIPWNFKTIMIGGAPYFMKTLHETLVNHGFKPVYAFSKRESVEIVQEDGSVKKINKFKHAGFVGMSD